MLREITSVEEMAELPSGTNILNRFRPPEHVRRQYNRADDNWTERVFRLKVRNGIPKLIGTYSTWTPKEKDFTDDDRYFVEVPE